MEKQIRNTVYIKKENKIQKITLLIDCEKLMNIRNEIIENCSRIVQVNDKMETTYLFNDYYSDPHYRNVKLNVIQYPYRDAGYGDDDQPGKRIVSYTYYDYPEIVDEIDSVLNSSNNLSNGLTLSFKEDTQLFDLEGIEEMLKGTVEQGKTKEKKKELRSIAETLLKETDPNIKHPIHKVSEYFEHIIDCYEVEHVQIIDEEVIKYFFEFFPFMNNKDNQENMKENIKDYDELSSYQQKILTKKPKDYILNGNDEQTFAKYSLILYNKQ